MDSCDDNYLIGIDVGTTSIKSVLINSLGNLIKSAVKEYTLDSGPNDICEIHPDIYWEITCQIIKELLNNSRIAPDLVKGIAFSSQGETLIAVDRRGKPLRKAIVWLDNRSTDEAKEIEQKFGRQLVMERTGQPEVVPTWPATRILWMQRNEPDIFRRVQKFLLVEDYLLFKMTGRYHTEHSLVSSTLYFDIVKKCWWDDMLKFLNISSEQLPQLNSSGTSIGSISVEAVKATGLTTKTQCVTGAYDHPSGAIGAGSINKGDVTLTIGASMAMCVVMDQPVADPALRLPCQCHAVKDLYFLLPYGQTAGMVLKWFRDEFCKEEIQNAELRGCDPYDLIVEQAQKIPVGADGLIMLPHLMGAGSPEFNSDAKGVFAGIKMDMTKGHFIRAILESVVFMINRNIQIMKQKGIYIRDINILGGGSKSSLWVQMLADMTALPVNTLMISDNAATGAALLAGVGTGIFKDLTSACQSSIKPNCHFDPDPLANDQLNKAYHKYIKLYECLELFWEDK